MLASIAIILLLVTPKFAKIQKMTDDMNRITRESLNGIRIVRAYNAESFQKEKFDNVNRDFTKTNLFTGRIMAFINPVMSITMNGISLVIYWVGAMIIKEEIICIP